MTRTRRDILALATAAALPVLPRRSVAQDYPDRSVRVVVGYPAGGSVDLFTRLVSQSLSEQLGQPFVIENRPGAAGNLGTDLVTRSSPDGYTLLAVGVNHATNAALYGNLKFDFERDIVPIASTVRGIGVLVVNPSFQPPTVSDFIAYAKANPGKINVASSGTGTPQHLFAELFKQLTGTDMLHVPYRGSPASLTALFAGDVQAMFDTLSTSIEHIKAGKLRALGVTSAEPSGSLPGVPAIAQFVPGYEATTWQGLGAPKATPAPIVEKLHAAASKAIAAPGVVALIEALGYAPFPTSQPDFAKLIADETQKWGKVTRAANIHLD